VAIHLARWYYVRGCRDRYVCRGGFRVVARNRARVFARQWIRVHLVL